jgi:hypothetical protein
MLRPEELRFAVAEYDKLRDEIAHLKQCQVSLLNYALIAIGGLAALLGLQSSGQPSVQLVIAGATIVTVIILVFGWLIVHKARSAFRAIAWCKIIEGFVTSHPVFAGLQYCGYETCYEAVRHHKWLLSRRGPGNPPKFVVCAWKMIRQRLEWTRARTGGDSRPKSTGPASNKIGKRQELYQPLPMYESITDPGRIGTYYRKLLIVIVLLATGAAAVGILRAYSQLSRGSLTVLAALFAVLISLSCGYLVMYCHWELDSFPFSIQCWYVMFIHALKCGVQPKPETSHCFELPREARLGKELGAACKTATWSPPPQALQEGERVSRALFFPNTIVIVVRFYCSIAVVTQS